MLNVGGGEFLVILLIALIVLGPQKLPEAARQIGKVTRELRRISTGFQQELKAALDEPIEDEARERGRSIVGSEEQPTPPDRAHAIDAIPEGAGAPEPSDPSATPEEGTGSATPESALTSPAAEAGMYDVADVGGVDDDADPTGLDR